MASLAHELYPKARGRGRPPFDGSAFCWSTYAGERHRVLHIVGAKVQRFVQVPGLPGCGEKHVHVRAVSPLSFRV